jgi:ABC-type transport system involved in Fe-S cluster assembly fused permease/ATPase subunit
MNTIPVTLEISILAVIAFLHPDIITANPNIIACLLLFAMGFQTHW